MRGKQQTLPLEQGSDTLCQRILLPNDRAARTRRRMRWHRVSLPCSRGSVCCFSRIALGGGKRAWLFHTLVCSQPLEHGCCPFFHGPPFGSFRAPCPIRERRPSVGPRASPLPDS